MSIQDNATPCSAERRTETLRVAASSTLSRLEHLDSKLFSIRSRVIGGPERHEDPPTDPVNNTSIVQFQSSLGELHTLLGAIDEYISAIEQTAEELDMI